MKAKEIADRIINDFTHGCRDALAKAGISADVSVNAECFCDEGDEICDNPKDDIRLALCVGDIVTLVSGSCDMCVSAFVNENVVAVQWMREDGTLLSAAVPMRCLELQQEGGSY